MRRALHPQQGRRTITVDGVTDSIAGWAQRLGVARATIVTRLALGWSEREAVTTPRGQPHARRYRREG